MFGRPFIKLRVGGRVDGHCAEVPSNKLRLLLLLMLTHLLIAISCMAPSQAILADSAILDQSATNLFSDTLSSSKIYHWCEAKTKDQHLLYLTDHAIVRFTPKSRQKILVAMPIKSDDIADFYCLHGGAAALVISGVTDEISIVDFEEDRWSKLYSRNQFHVDKQIVQLWRTPEEGDTVVWCCESGGGKSPTANLNQLYGLSMLQIPAASSLDEFNFPYDGILFYGDGLALAFGNSYAVVKLTRDHSQLHDTIDSWDGATTQSEALLAIASDRLVDKRVLDWGVRAGQSPNPGIRLELLVETVSASANRALFGCYFGFGNYRSNANCVEVATVPNEMTVYRFAIPSPDEAIVLGRFAESACLYQLSKNNTRCLVALKLQKAKTQAGPVMGDLPDFILSPDNEWLAIMQNGTISVFKREVD